MSTPKELIKGLRANEIDIQTALQKFENPATHVKDISFRDMQVHPFSCGFPTLDEHAILKSNKPELITVGARPGTGKSQFLLQVGWNVSLQANVVVFSLEMDKESMKARLVASQFNIPLKKIQRGEVDRTTIASAQKGVEQRGLFIIDDCPPTIEDIKRVALTIHRSTPIGLLIIDYIQLVRTATRATRHEELGIITGELKQLGKLLKCPVMTASQLNRQSESRGMATDRDGNAKGSFRPTLSDLRDSGSIEQDSDIVIFLSREFLFTGNRQHEIDVDVAKNKNGSLGRYTFKWYGSITNIVDPSMEAL